MQKYRIQFDLIESYKRYPVMQLNFKVNLEPKSAIIKDLKCEYFRRDVVLTREHRLIQSTGSRDIDDDLIFDGDVLLELGSGKLFYIGYKDGALKPLPYGHGLHIIDLLPSWCNNTRIINNIYTDPEWKELADAQEE